MPQVKIWLQAQGRGEGNPHQRRGGIVLDRSLT